MIAWVFLVGLFLFFFWCLVCLFVVVMFVVFFFLFCFLFFLMVNYISGVYRQRVNLIRSGLLTTADKHPSFFASIPGFDMTLGQFQADICYASRMATY